MDFNVIIIIVISVISVLSILYLLNKNKQSKAEAKEYYKLYDILKNNKNNKENIIFNISNLLFGQVVIEGELVFTSWEKKADDRYIVRRRVSGDRKKVEGTLCYIYKENSIEYYIPVEDIYKLLADISMQNFKDTYLDSYLKSCAILKK